MQRFTCDETISLNTSTTGGPGDVISGSRGGRYSTVK